MKKITLSLDALRVESFSTTTRDAAPRGTVHGADGSEDTGCLAPSCGTCEPTFAYSCYGSCVGETCAPECTGEPCTGVGTVC